MKFKAALFILTLCGLLFRDLAYSQVFERSRSESETWKIYKETSLEIYNKYGSVHLFPWEKDSVRIDIEMKVKAAKESKVDKIFDYIDFEFSENKYYIIARTRFNQQGEFWSEVTDLANTFFSSGTKVQIDYSVYLPSTISLKIENKFGNIYTTDHQGKISVVLSNGDLKANDLKGKTDLNISFGNADINSIVSGKISLNYSELGLGNTSSLEVESKSSTLNIAIADNLTINAKRDKYFINQLKVLNGKSSFSYVTVKSFKSDLILETDYGKVTVENVSPEFKLIDLTSSFTDIILKLPGNTSFLTDISHNSSTQINAPGSYSGLKTEIIDKKNELYHTKGTAGNGTINKGRINMKCTSGKIIFQEIE